MPPTKQRERLLIVLEAASGHDAALRNILLDPALLGADRFSAIGKLYPDTKSPGALNVAKMVHAFCMAEWGCSTRDAILDDGKPAGRLFKESRGEAKVPPHSYKGTPDDPQSGDLGLPVYEPMDAAAFFTSLSALRQARPLPSVPSDAELRARFRWECGCDRPDLDADYARIDADVVETQWKAA
jgi:hypothetical protein